MKSGVLLGYYLWSEAFTLTQEARVTVTLTKASAVLVSDVYLRKPYDLLLIANNLLNEGRTIDTVYDPCTNLEFGIVIHGPGGDYEHNSFSKYCRRTEINDSTYELGFEDLPDSIADWDFNDVVLRVELNTVSGTNAQAGEASVATFDLLPNSPNPFNPVTVISYSLREKCPVNLSVYNTQGTLVRTLIQGEQGTGVHSAAWNAAGLPSEVYFIKIQAGAHRATRKALLMK
jgi:hypothetical protein